MSAIGKRVLNLFIGADINFRDPSDASILTLYRSIDSMLTRVSDSIDPNRQYVGQMTKALSFDYSLFSPENNIGGRSKRNFGELRLFKPRFPHVYRLDNLFDEDMSVQDQPIVYRMGEKNTDLGSMITFFLRGRNFYPSEDGTEAVIDVADGGQSLDTSIQLDRFQGLHKAILHETGEFSTIAASAGLDGSSAFYAQLFYRLDPGTTLASDLLVWELGASGGGLAQGIWFLTTGYIKGQSRTTANATVTTTTTDLQWVADGRWHSVGLKWDGALLYVLHSTRTGGAVSEDSTAQTTLKASSGALSIGDCDSSDLPAGYKMANTDFRLYLDANVPTDDVLKTLMKRTLTEDEWADLEFYVRGEITGTTPTWSSADETVNNHDLTPHATAQQTYTFEGLYEMAGKAKPLSFGHIFNAPVTWVDQGNGVSTVHSRTIVGVKKVFEGGERRLVGWPRTLFRDLSFDNATKTIFFPSRTLGGASRIDAQPGLCGLIDGQHLLLEAADGGVNGGTWTVVGDSTERLVEVSVAPTNETGKDYWITALRDDDSVCEVDVYHSVGGLKFKNKASLPCSAEIIGDIGREIPTSSASFSAPEYTAAIMRVILTDWAGEPDVAANWDDAVTGPTNYEGSYFADAGVWIDPNNDTKMREVMDEGADSIWASWGENLVDDEWDLFQVTAPSQIATPDVELTSLEMHGIRQVSSIAPIGGYTIECTRNYQALDEQDTSGIAQGDDDAEALQRENLSASAVPDSAVLLAYPTAEKPAAKKTWIRYLADAQAEAQRRYDILKVKREVFEVESWLYCLDKNVQHCLVNLLCDRFPSLVSGKNLWLIRISVDAQKVSLTLWG